MLIARPDISFSPKSPFLILLVLAAFSTADMACNSSRSRELPNGPLIHRTKPVLHTQDIERKIHALINRERLKQGVAALVWDDLLAKIARGHSKDMASRHYFSHDSPEGHDLSFRYRQDEYSCNLRIGNTVHMGAENIFLNVRYNSVTTLNGEEYYDWNSEEQLAETTVRGGMNSPGHRKNILTPYWRSEGIGVYVAPDEKIYITQNFC